MTAFTQLANLAACLYMTGLIWMVQVVHYPLLARVGMAEFVHYERLHQQWITPIVFVPMLAQLVSSLALLWLRPVGVPAWVWWLGAALAGVVWLSTALWQVPLHNQLSQGHSPVVITQLVRSNWLRTAAWTVHSLLLLWALYTQLRSHS